MQQDEARLRHLARQYNWLRQRGDSHAEALTQLQNECDDSYRSLLTRLAATRHGVAAEPFIANQLGGLSRVLDQSDIEPEQRPALLMAALVLGDQLRDIGAEIRQSLVTRYSYMTVLCLVGLIVSCVYVFHVYPQMVSINSMLTTAMPVELSPLYHLGLFGYPLIFLILSGLSVLMYGLSLKSSYALGSGKDFAAPVHFLPGVSAINSALKQFLSTGLQQLFVRSGLSPAKSADLSRHAVSVDNPSQDNALKLAMKLDTVENEFSYQLEESRRRVDSAIDHASSLWNKIVTAVTAIVLFLMITDYYRPIFRMGAI